jgi:hypothetical protein
MPIAGRIAVDSERWHQRESRGLADRLIFADFGGLNTHKVVMR